MIKTFSIKTVCLLGYQMINILEFIHNKHIIHRDIKPDNFVMGLNNLSKNLYLLDFGLARKYRSSVNLVHYPLINKKKLTGTARYASINALKGYEQSRRDDLEAVGYVLMYFLRGSLPWQGQPGKNKEERYKRILQKKMETSPYDLCNGFPQEFEKYIEYTRKMEYVEQPLYNNLRENFIRIIEKQKEDFDYIYDWSTVEEKKLRRKEYLEEIASKKNKKTIPITEDANISTKNGIESKMQSGELDKISNNKEKKINKYLDEEKIGNNKTRELKVNNKFATKESSLEGNNNYKKFNSNNINSRRNSKHKNSNNNIRKNSENGNELKKENEEICCSQACTIF